LTSVKEFMIGAATGFKTIGFDTNGKAIQGNAQTGGTTAPINVKRLNQLGIWDGSTFTPNALATTTTTNAHILFICSGTANTAAGGPLTVSFPVADSFTASSTGGDTLVIPSFESDFGTTPSPAIPEIDIKV